MIQLLNGNTLKIPLADGSVHMAVTSPPYWGLRDYQTDGQLGLERVPDCLGWATGAPCGECYICHTVAWAREVKRVLRDDGTFWMNIGDSYTSSLTDKRGTYSTQRRWQHGADRSSEAELFTNGMEKKDIGNLKPKDLCMIPARVALALQADGWWLRSDIIWSKPNPMPESVTDRPTKSHEYLFLFSKQPRYYYDAEAVREEYSENKPWGKIGNIEKDYHGGLLNKRFDYSGSGRNRRSVWHIATAPYSGAHFATYPPALVEPCIKAGTSERGCCPKCGKQWVRVVNTSYTDGGGGGPSGKIGTSSGMIQIMPVRKTRHDTTLGFRPDCDCGLEPVPCVVFDPFAGSGTTLLVARKLGRSAVGLDLSMEYLQSCARSRLSLDALNEFTNGKQAAGDLSDLPLFQEVR